MAGDRDWDKELAKIDKQLGSLSDEELTRAQPQLPAKGGAAPTKADKPSRVSGERTTRGWAVYLRLLLSVGLGVGILFWPYPSRCGWGLAGYLAVIAAIIGSGVWSSVWTFRHRAAKAHLLALLVTLWGLVLGAVEVLPRVGYAKPDLGFPSTWICPANPPPQSSSQPPPSQQPSSQQPSAQPK